MTTQEERSVANLASLERLMSIGEVVAFVGSGLSSGVYPEWKELVRRLCEACGLKIERDALDGAPAQLMHLCDQAKTMDPEAYYRTLGEIFDRKTTTRKAYEYLVRAGFRNYVTTNFDCLLADEIGRYAESRGVKEESVFAYPGCEVRFLRREKTASYLHGYISPGCIPGCSTAIVLSQEDFDLGYGAESKLPILLNVLFTEHPICFIGCQLQELPLQRVFREAQGIRARLRGEYKHPVPGMFILLEDWGIPADGCKQKTFTRLGGVVEATAIQVRDGNDETAYYEDLGIKVIRYPRFPDHKGLDDVLRKLARISEPSIYKPRDEELPYEG